MPCPVCDDAGSIRLPYKPSANILSIQPVSDEITLTARTYPCPECSKDVSTSRVQIASVAVVSKYRLIDDEALDIHARIAAKGLVETLINAGLITYERIKHPANPNTVVLRASIGVVAKDVVRSIQDRIKYEQDYLANATISEASDLLETMPSELTRSMVRDMLNIALSSVKTRRLQIEIARSKS